jgi:inner membrane protein
MTGPTHILFGISTGIVLCRTSLFVLDPVSFVCLFLGSLGPDIDADSGSITKPGRLFRGFLPRGVANVLDQFGTLMSAIARSISGHRGFFHTPLLALGILSASWYLSLPRLEWFGIGYLSHIIADACTKKGVPLLWPVRQREYSFLPIKTGSATEAWLAMSLVFFVIIVGWGLLPETTRQGFESIRQAVMQRQGWR